MIIAFKVASKTLTCDVIDTHYLLMDANSLLIALSLPRLLPIWTEA